MSSANRQHGQKSSRPRLARLLEEPVFHFFLLGIAVFLLYRATAPRSWAAAENNLVFISSDFVQALRDRYAERTGRIPGSDEERGLIDGFVQEEVLYREGLKLGLNQGDPVIRRRIVQKMEFLFRDTGAIRQPTEEELASYMDANAQSFEIPARTSFTHIFFSREKRGARALVDAEQALGRLRQEQEEVTRAPEWGDPFLMQYDFRRKSKADVSSVFGSAFAERLVSIEAGTWSGPVSSDFGFHLVRVHDREPARVPLLREVYGKVKQAWISERETAAKREAYDRLMDKYEVVVQAPLEGSVSTLR
jgi:hypothetical protein